MLIWIILGILLFIGIIYVFTAICSFKLLKKNQEINDLEQIQYLTEHSIKS